MQKFTYLLAFQLIFAAAAISQTTDKVSQLVSAENYFAALAKEKGIKKAFLSVSNESTIIFRPGPISATKYFKGQPDSLGILTWEPVFARISKSGDWGITSGPSTYQKNDSSEVHYGDYLSVWKKNAKGVWKLALDLGVTHPKPKKQQALLFQNPKNEIFLKQRSENRLQQREDVVFSSDRLMGTILKADDKIALKEFIADESRLLFPGFEPIIGKKAITTFWEKQGFNLASEPTKADRSYSGELAYTYGEANISKKGANNKYHYVRIWEIQPGYVWKVIFEAYSLVPAEEEVESE
jgi:ketosteroid isomerase-like protein